MVRNVDVYNKICLLQITFLRHQSHVAQVRFDLLIFEYLLLHAQAYCIPVETTVHITDMGVCVV